MIFPEISDTGQIVAVAIRIIAPVFILRWPLGGMVVSMIADTSDVVVVAAIQSGPFKDYTPLDKLLDTYALGYAASVSLFWRNSLAKRTSIVLFAYRLTGILVLALTGSRLALVLFPNVFEFFYLYHLSTVKWFQNIEVDRYQRFALVLSLLIPLKMVQEYVLHAEGFNSFPYLYSSAIVTGFFCLPVGTASIFYITMHYRETGRGDLAKAVQFAAKAKLLGWVTAAIGSGFVMFWAGLAGLNFTVNYGQVF